ncbi:unnamed protein product [Mycena citricolor]|uniref:Zn(2)-C6 fungal-type domain-containing protein n=1 Tax=Mycena citricolor TaxID=2018698 RepID=A0AAD2HWA5_9AGAR|nr:unnamed protein product [Mycena citricolor]
MDDSFQFIIESPQNTTGHKKRPRLVTSCDNCRLKKIKCLQSSPESKCEACKVAKVACRFKDRERYFAERSRAIAGPNVGSPYGEEPRSPSLDMHSVPSSASPVSPRSSSNSPRPSGVAVPDGDPRYLSYPPESRRSTDRRGASSTLRSSRPDPIGRSPGARPLPLFDPDRPQFPLPTYMSHFIQLFFQEMAPEFPYVTYDDVSTRFMKGTLPALLANCIAALAARSSTDSELAARGLSHVAETYADNAKTILAPISQIPQLTTLHGLMLLCWFEYKNSRMDGLRGYFQMAMAMAMKLGLSEQNPPAVNASEAERNIRRSTWACVLQLHLTVTSYS